jgi:hypothetical protein
MGPERKFARLADRINAGHDRFLATLKRGFNHAMRTGELLIEAKALVGHGKWLLWFRNNCRMAERTAQVYMRLARNRGEVESADLADLTINGVLATLALPDEPPEPDLLNDLGPLPRKPTAFPRPQLLDNRSEEDRRRDKEQSERLRQKEAAEIARFKQFFVDNPMLNDFLESGIGYHWAVAFGQEQRKFIDAVGLVKIYEAASTEEQQKLKDHLTPERMILRAGKAAA